MDAFEAHEAGEAERRAAGMVDGRHYSAHAAAIKAMQRAGNVDGAAALLARCVEAVEREAVHPVAGHVGVPPWFHAQLAGVHEKAGRSEEAAAVMRRFDLLNAQAAESGQRLLEEMRKQISGADVDAPGLPLRAKRPRKAPPAPPTLKASPPRHALERLLGWIRGKR